ncbi:MAG: methyltransferase domain-containing protein [Eubacterium sp.]|nr:methyltransferase domain-containing protein [Eubacterium sp.]
MSDWNASQYLKFEQQRTVPAIDLIKKADVVNPQKIIDIGCGPGNSTAVLKDFYPEADILGVDYSDNMLKKAKSKYPEISFEKCDAGKDLKNINEKYDLVFSNACIQWIPNHKELIKDMLGILSDNGVLAVQAPINGNAPLFKIIKEVASDSKWHFPSDIDKTNRMLETSRYFDILNELASYSDIWETVYYHSMPSHNALIEWVKGTRLLPYLNALSNEIQQEFLNEILEKAKAAYPIQKNGEIIFHFRRFFFIAKK